MKLSWKAAPVAAVLAGLALSACSSIQPSLGEYAIVTGHGNLSNQQVQAVVSPGDQVHLGSGTTSWYFPANVRNYVTLPNNGDRDNPQAEITGSAGQQVGMSDLTWTYVTFEVNPAITLKKDNYKTATAFLQFCLKYGCADTSPQNDASNAGQVRSSDPGWENMLNEVMPRAIDDATRNAIVTYGPDLWTNRAKWTEYGNKISANLQTELMDLAGATIPYFCGPGSTVKDCKALAVIVQNVTPTDKAVVNAYNQQVSAQYAQQAGASRLAAAKEIYGSDANFFLGAMDLVNQCAEKSTTCNIYLGNPPSAPGR